MKSIVFHILKGGVGKTTISANIAAFLATKGKTLLIDADTQGNTSNWFLSKNQLDVECTLVRCVKSLCSLSDAIVEIRNNFFLLPTTSTNNELKIWAETELISNPFAFLNLNEDLEKASFDFIVFDLSPSISLLERSIIASCDEVVIPLEAEMFSIDGLESFMAHISDIQKKYRKTIIHNKIVCNKLNKSLGRQNAIYEKIQTLVEDGFEIFTVPQDARLAECPLYHESIFECEQRWITEKKIKSNEHLKSTPKIIALGEALCL